MMTPDRWVRLASQGNSVTSGAGDTYLRKVNIGTVAGSSSVVIMDNAGGAITGGTTSTSASKVVAKIDTANASGRAFDYGHMLVTGGFVAFCLGGNPDVTITYR